MRGRSSWFKPVVDVFRKAERPPLKVEKKKPIVRASTQPYIRPIKFQPVLAPQRDLFRANTASIQTALTPKSKPVTESKPVKVVQKRAYSTKGSEKGSDHQESKKSSGPEDSGAYKKFNSLFSPENIDKAQSLAALIMFVGVVLLLLNKIKQDNVQDPVIDKSVLRSSDDVSDLAVVDALTLKVADHNTTSGRSRGHKVFHKGEDEEHKTYYYKEPFSRDGFLNELIIGALARELFGEKFPRVYAVETPVNDLDDGSRYGLISESINETTGNMNLEQWAIQYSGNKLDYAPTHLGTSIAFDMLFGKTDCKLANLIVKKANGGNCYSIDHESARNLPVVILQNPKDALEFIGEFAPKTFGEHMFEQQVDGAINTQTENLHQPLKGNAAVKEIISPILAKAIKNDIESGAIDAFYERFAKLSEADLKKIFSRFGALIHPDEEKDFLFDIQTRQAVVRVHLARKQAAKSIFSSISTAASSDPSGDSGIKFRR